MDNDEPTETEMSRPAVESKPTGASPTTCPSCGRDVEAGFKFCDYCGTKLEPGPLRPGPHEDKPRPLFARLKIRRSKGADDAASALAAGMSAPDEAPPIPPAIEDITPPPERPAAAPQPERAAASASPPKEAAPPTEPPPSPAPPTEATTPPPPRPTSQLTTVEDLRTASSEGRAGISGRLRWREGEDTKDTADTKDTDAGRRRAEEIRTSWRAVESPPSPPPSRVFTARDGLTFVAHVLIAFLVGAALVGVAAVVASLMSDGRVALLEVRGLPIFIAGASAIIVFSLLRTGPRRRLGPRAVALSVLVGFVILVIGVAIAYQPSLMAEAQSRLDRALGVFGNDVIEGIDRYEADVDQWNAEVHQYSDVELTKLSKARDTETDAAKLAKAEETFRVEASGSEEALDGILKRMRSHADGIGHAPLREALTDLTGIFADELSGIHLITRGFVNDDQALIQSGDTRFKDATQRAVEFFDDRVRPILERGDIDPDSLGLAIEDLRG
jgi:zinc ribbon protein